MEGASSHLLVLGPDGGGWEGSPDGSRDVRAEGSHHDAKKREPSEGA